MKRQLNDILLKNVQPPDYKTSISSADLADVLVRRLGLQRKSSHAKHAELLLWLLQRCKEQVPVTMEQMARVLGVSVSQAYEELKKWRSLSLLEVAKVPVRGSSELMKGYLLAGGTINQLLDRVQSSANAFIRATRRIAKDLDDQLSAEVARAAKKE